MSDPAPQAEELAFQGLAIASDSERAAFWDKACAGDAALRAEVGRIWAEHREAETFLADCRPSVLSDATEAIRTFARTAPPPAESAEACADFDADRLVGTRIGPYALRRKLGEGGCGVVYLAEQEHPLRRQVALKVIKLGMDTRGVIARFEAERQALAIMDHPNIARVFDAGATETGRPYFVMELVPGIRITTYCDEARLDLRQRLDLFVDIAGAIQHAHQKGIVHRDLKPSNILVATVDGKPTPKVIDFGIAKAANGDRLTDATLRTAVEQFIGTPAYMSPEQAQMGGVDVDTRSDIYSLGALLYELLTGKTPFDQAELLSQGLDRMRRTLLERDPPPPSARLRTASADERSEVALRRRAEPPRLRASLEGDLDWIVMKALEKDRSRRYQTASDFAADIRRHRNHEPVSAGAPGRMYRLRKLARRHRVVFAATAAVAVALVAGTGTSTWLFFRAQAAYREAELARRNETRLRGEADARAKIAQAALLISRDKMPEADRLVDRIEVPVTEPSLEAASVLRALGMWNVTHGRWRTAADRFVQLERANQLDPSNTTEEVTRDLLGAGPALIVAGDIETYRRFVHATAARFADTTDPVAAEQVVKNSLILPPDAETLRRLEPLLEVVRASVARHDPDAPGDDRHVAWQSLTLSLHAYRRGNYAESVSWAERGLLRYRDRTDARLAMTHAVLALSQARLGRMENAAKALAAAAASVRRHLPAGEGPNVELGRFATGMWHDWLITKLLLQEAEALTKPPAPSP